METKIDIEKLPTMRSIRPLWEYNQGIAMHFGVGNCGYKLSEYTTVCYWYFLGYRNKKGAIGVIGDAPPRENAPRRQSGNRVRNIDHSIIFFSEVEEPKLRQQLHEKNIPCLHPSIDKPIADPFPGLENKVQVCDTEGFLKYANNWPYTILHWWHVPGPHTGFEKLEADYGPYVMWHRSINMTVDYILMVRAINATGITLYIVQYCHKHLERVNKFLSDNIRDSTRIIV